MSAKYRAGDRVRVVLEGEVRGPGPDPIDNSFKVGFNRINPNDSHVVSVEKVEPPVVTFKPGDKIRSRSWSRIVVTLGTKGYLQHYSEHAGGEVMFHPYVLAQRETFNSGAYELVE